MTPIATRPAAVESRGARPTGALPATWVALAVALVVVPGGAAAQPSEPFRPMPPQPDVVVTSGEAVIKAAPDQAFVNLTVENRAKAPRDAQRQTAEAMSAVQQKLRAAGVESEAIRTLNVELSPEFDYVNGRQQLRGYVARNSVEVRVDALDRLGEYIDLAVGTGATNVAGIRFDIRRREELEREALKRAVANARARADAAASGAGRSIERVLRIDDTGAIVAPPPRPMAMAARAEMASDAMTPIAAGELEVRARVTLTGLLK